MNDSAQLALSIINYVMPIVLLVWIIFFSILGVILKYHWKRYGVEQDKSKKMFIVYFAIGLVLIGIMLASYIAYLIF